MTLATILLIWLLAAASVLPTPCPDVDIDVDVGLIQTMVSQLAAIYQFNTPELPRNLPRDKTTFIELDNDERAPCNSKFGLVINPSWTPPVFVARKCAHGSGRSVDKKKIRNKRLEMKHMPSGVLVKCGQRTRPTWVMKSICNGTHRLQEKTLVEVPVMCTFE